MSRCLSVSVSGCSERRSKTRVDAQSGLASGGFQDACGRLRLHGGVLRLRSGSHTAPFTRDATHRQQWSARDDDAFDRYADERPCDCGAHRGAGALAPRKSGPADLPSTILRATAASTLYDEPTQTTTMIAM